METTERHTVPPADRVEIVDALYRFGTGQDLHDPALFDSADRERLDDGRPVRPVRCRSSINAPGTAELEGFRREAGWCGGLPVRCHIRNAHPVLVSWNVTARQK